MRVESKTHLNFHTADVFKSRRFYLNPEKSKLSAAACIFYSKIFLVLVVHHIASDGWSISVVVKELIELYSANIESREANLPKLPIQFADYAIWQRKYLSGELLDKKLSYWKIFEVGESKTLETF